MKSYLKVKVCTLAAESKSIKIQERRWKKRAARARAKSRDTKFAEDNFFGLRGHRVGKHGVRAESRDSNLAYGFLCNRAYATMELFAYTKPDWANIEKMVKKFGDDPVAPDARDIMQRFSGWKHDAEIHFLSASGDHALAADIKAKDKQPHLPGTKRPA
jgi:hypothetical protein